ncbi:hypothetical protein BPAE_0143g00280 [Botrytis paeoniae]|uniref:2EXR domain-containing protein n=1 Tax=Botrytis paeoniae TaxID=278948 RepID=A0A4Z1FHW8_9HELO|nr:hypothetical protein BPAE_0143g00280 [Botrytis paeoniae]
MYPFKKRFYRHCVCQSNKRIYNFILKQRRRSRRREVALRVAREEFFHHSLPGGCYFIPEYQDFISIPSSNLSLRRGIGPMFYEKNFFIFTLFGNLPAEIQLMIWEFASNKPTYLENRYRTHQKELVHLSRNQEAQGQIGNLEKFTGTGGVNYHNDSLGLLRVCHDSRTIAKKTRSQPYRTNYGNPVYIDFAIDTIFVIDSGA